MELCSMLKNPYRQLLTAEQTMQGMADKNILRIKRFLKFKK